MKKLFFMAVAAIAALSSCTSDNELELNQNTGKEALTFTATMEDSEATRATYDSENKYALWEAGDQISINGVSYSAQEGAGAKATFKATTTGVEAEGPFTAYFPADLYDGTTATLPAIQTYTAGKFNMPMYAESSTTELAFKNLCAVLAIKVTNADIATLKSIKVASDKKMNGTFTVTGNTAIVGEDGTNAVVLESSEALTLNETGTTFYIAIPAQKYNYLNIFLSADGKTYTQAMATKKAAGLGAIARSTIFNIDYAKNATKLWAGNLLIADCNVGATSATETGSTMTFTDATKAGAEYVWGANWCTPSQEDMEHLMTAAKGETDDKVKCEYTQEGSQNGFKFTGLTDGYTDNSVFFPAQSGDSNIGDAYYWSGTANGSEAWGMYLSCNYGSWLSDWGSTFQGVDCLVRPVLEEAASPAPAAPATTGTAKATIGGEDVDVNWVQLWENGPKFAEYNVGVTDSKAESFGGYYAWGGNQDKVDDHNTGTDALSGDNDTATKLWGSKWRMPTQAEFEALLANCDVEWTAVNGVNGKKFTGQGDYASNSIFLPAAGSCNKGSVASQGSSGRYWSIAPESTFAYQLYFKSSSQSVGSYFRGYGLSVRAVLNE